MATEAPVRNENVSMRVSKFRGVYSLGDVMRLLMGTFRADTRAAKGSRAFSDRVSLPENI